MTQASRSTSCTVWILALLAAGLAGAGARTLLAPTGPRTDEGLTVRDTAAVVMAVRDLAMLESAAYHLERVIDMRDRQAHLFGLFESEDAVLLVAAVDVVAGVDLRGLRDGDIQLDAQRTRATLILPPPQILSARLDSDRTYVHTRATSALAIPGKSLESRARREAEHALREAAIAAGILERARDNASRTLRALLLSLGFREVEVRFQLE